MDNDTLDTRNKILQTAMNIVGRKGEVTIREITEEAGVNVAAINYYFGNKSNLLKEVENYYSDLLYGMQYEILVNEKLTPKEKLSYWAKNLIEFMFKFPALIMLIVNLSNEDKHYNPILIQKIYLNKEFQHMIEDIIKQGTGLEDKKLLSFKYMQVFSGILGLVVGRVVANTFGEGESTFDITAPEEIEEYIDLIVNSILTK